MSPQINSGIRATPTIPRSAARVGRTRVITLLPDNYTTTDFQRNSVDKPANNTTRIALTAMAAPGPPNECSDRPGNCFDVLSDSDDPRTNLRSKLQGRVTLVIYTRAYDTRSTTVVALGPYIAGFNIAALVEAPDLCCKACWI
jgi:hypothetical protein